MLRRITARGIAALALPLAAGLPAAAGAKAPHDGWPKRTGELYINKVDANAEHHGTSRNDELLGGHGADRLFGGGGRDVLWGDSKPVGNNETQADLLDGGPGGDFLYASHGENVLIGGTGADVIRAHFGRGYIDCGPGRDTLFISHRARPGYRVRHCERISYKPARQG